MIENEDIQIYVVTISVDDTLPPQACGAMDGCSGNMLAAWAVGINGICLNQDVGIRIGKNGAKAASLRVCMMLLVKMKISKLEFFGSQCDIQIKIVTIFSVYLSPWKL